MKQKIYYNSLTTQAERLTKMPEAQKRGVRFERTVMKRERQELSQREKFSMQNYELRIEEENKKCLRMMRFIEVI